MIPAEIKKLLKPLKRKMHIQKGLEFLSLCTAAAGGAASFTALVSLFIPLPFRAYIISAFYALSMLTFMLAMPFLAPGELKLIRQADALGLKERLITLYELKDMSTEIAKLLLGDSIKAVRALDFREAFRIRFPVKPALVSLLLFVMALSVLLVPSAAPDTAREYEAFYREIREHEKKLTAEAENIRKNSSLPEDKLEKLNEDIEKLINELKKSTNREDAAKAFARAKNEVLKLNREEYLKSLASLAGNLSQNPFTRNAAKALQEGRPGEFAKELEDLKRKLSTLSPEELNELSKLFSEAAAKNDNKALAETLDKLAGAFESSNLKAAAEGLDALSASVPEAGAGSGQEIPGFSGLESLSSYLASAGYNIQKPEAFQQSPDGGTGGHEGSGSEKGDSALEGGGSAEGQSGGSSEKGSGTSGNGEGNPQSEGSGSGAGEGSTNTGSEGGGSEQGGGAKVPQDKKVRQYENIYVPTRLGDEGSTSNIEGKKGTSGESTFMESPDSPVFKGETVPYDRVLPRYTGEAMSAMEKESIPPAMKDIVREYFTSLE